MHHYIIPFKSQVIFHMWVIYRFTNIWVASTFWLLLTMLPWIFVYKFLCGHRSPLLGIYPGVERPSQALTLFLAFSGAAKVFSRAAASFCIPTSDAGGLRSVRILSNTCYCFFDRVLRVGGNWRLNGSLGLHFPDISWHGASFHVLIGHSYLCLGANVYFNSLPLFKLGYLSFSWWAVIPLLTCWVHISYQR